MKLACSMPEESGPSFKLTVEKYTFQKELVVSRDMEPPDVCTFLGEDYRMTKKGVVPVQRWADPDGAVFIVYGMIEEWLN